MKFLKPRGAPCPSFRLHAGVRDKLQLYLSCCVREGMMTELINEKCEACRADSPRVTDEEVAELQPVVSEWAIIEENEIPKLQRVFRYPNFVSSLAFTDAVGALAEEQGHHPRIVTEWGRVTVTWWTHKIRNLHRNDFVMAAKTDQLYQPEG